MVLLIGLSWLLSLVGVIDSQTQLTTIKLFKAQKTWNDALQFCSGKSMNLLEVRTKAKADALDWISINTLVWQNKFQDSWIGLHDPDSSTKFGYSWAEGCTPHGQEGTSWSDWYTNEPLNYNSNKCVKIVKEGSVFAWRAESCNQKKMVFCESVGGNCTFHRQNQDVSISVLATVSKSDILNLQACQFKCSIYKDASVECWGVTFASSCVFHVASGPIPLGSPLDSSTFYAKKCFVGAYDGTDDQNSPDTRSDPGTDCIAGQAMAELATTTTTTTTTTSTTTTTTTTTTPTTTTTTTTPTTTTTTTTPTPTTTSTTPTTTSTTTTPTTTTTTTTPTTTTTTTTPTTTSTTTIPTTTTTATTPTTTSTTTTPTTTSTTTTPTTNTIPTTLTTVTTIPTTVTPATTTGTSTTPTTTVAPTAAAGTTTTPTPTATPTTTTGTSATPVTTVALTAASGTTTIQTTTATPPTTTTTPIPTSTSAATAATSSVITSVATNTPTPSTVATGAPSVSQTAATTTTANGLTVNSTTQSFADAWGLLGYDICSCNCNSTDNKTLEEKIEEIVLFLTVDKSKTSKSIRKRISVPDNRPSAQNIGFLGIAVLVATGGLFLVADSTYIFQIFKFICRKKRGPG
ncbi:mucin-5AC-like [Haliotis rubra]|uniref:mucin-5AC-like n=1 Tax=Haliotis rubra TaxID=36100 RepID=UPI001EE4ED19|nr:mucin-5AC-like [Haliotis rubra]